MLGASFTDVRRERIGWFEFIEHRESSAEHSQVGNPQRGWVRCDDCGGAASDCAGLCSTMIKWGLVVCAHCWCVHDSVPARRVIQALNLTGRG
jgi:hypothetical protein